MNGPRPQHGPCPQRRLFSGSRTPRVAATRPADGVRVADRVRASAGCVICLVLASLLLATGCARAVGRVQRLTQQAFPPRPSDYPIQITEADFKDDPYVEIAIATSRAYDDRMIDVAGPADLRKLARALGGDAVIRIVRNGVVREEFGYRPGNLMRRGARFTDQCTLSGIVVRFKRER